MSFPLRRLELNNPGLIGGGYDLVDVRVLPPEGEPTIATFMLDSGLTLNLVTPELADQLRLPLAGDKVDAAALGGQAKRLSMASMPGLELVAPQGENATCYSGVWEGGGGWRALASLDWEAWVAEAQQSGGRVAQGAIRYTCLPSLKGENYVGLAGTEFVAGELDGAGARFEGGGVAVEPKGFLKVANYTFSRQGEELVEASSGMRLRPSPAVSSLPLGPVLATAVPFAQSALAATQGVELQGMLGQYPLYRDFVLDVDPTRRRLSVYRDWAVASLVGADGLLRLPGESLGSSLVGVRLAHAPLAAGSGRGQRDCVSVPAMVDSGSANTILNWPAAEKLLGLQRDDRVVRDAPIIRAVGVGGGQVDMPLLTLSLGLGAEAGGGGELELLRAQPVQVAIGDVDVFADIAGYEEQGSWPLGLGPKPLRAAAILGQDVLSQQRYLFAASEPALYMQPQPDRQSGRLDFVGMGDCLDAGGRRLRGLQRLGCTPDFAAEQCLSLPAGACGGIAVTPLDTRGQYSGLCYIFVESDEAAAPLVERGFQRYTAGPGEQELAPVGAVVEKSTGTRGADCFRWRAP